MKGKQLRPSLVALTAIVLLLIVYPLSVGPVCFLFQYFDWGPVTYTIQEGIVLFYSPLDHLPDPLDSWIADWWNYGMDLGCWAAES